MAHKAPIAPVTLGCLNRRASRPYKGTRLREAWMAADSVIPLAESPNTI